MSVPTGSVLKLRSATKAFRTAGTQVRALDSISLDIGPGEFVSIMGRSGSGKSTLLNVIGCLDELTDGQYLVHGTEVRDLSMRQITSLRNRSFGFVFQAYHLVSTATAIENVELPMKYAGIRQRERRKRATELLERFGITECATRLPTEMSGG
ncbi:MAG: ATP-binding cassette domain-containing protein, partial [Trueperaceae bacterium]|nr:ATP-binding cassette domain-containing protein [Trueperaceae bacterium]